MERILRFIAITEDHVSLICIDNVYLCKEGDLFFVPALVELGLVNYNSILRCVIITDNGLDAIGKSRRHPGIYTDG